MWHLIPFGAASGQDIFLEAPWPDRWCLLHAKAYKLVTNAYFQIEDVERRAERDWTDLTSVEKWVHVHWHLYEDAHATSIVWRNWSASLFGIRRPR